MPPTVLRRASTLVVGALFAVVFICSGVSTAQPVTTRTEAVVSAHTATSKVAVRDAIHTVKLAKTPLQLASTGPVTDEAADVPDTPATIAAPILLDSPTTFAASERAPPTR